MDAAEWDTTPYVPSLFEALEERRVGAEAVRDLVLRLIRGDGDEPFAAAGSAARAVYDAMLATLTPPERPRRPGWYGLFFLDAYGHSEEGFRLMRHHADTIREQVANPYAPSPVRADWLTSDVTRLAAGIRAEAAFDRMPILADALQDAGCDSERVLTHCRQTDRPHHTGCWLLASLEQAHRGLLSNTESRDLLRRLAGRLRRRVAKHLVVYLAARLRLDERFRNLVTGSTGWVASDAERPEFLTVCRTLDEAGGADDPVEEYLSAMRDWHLRGFDECRLIREYVPDA